MLEEESESRTGSVRKSSAPTTVPERKATPHSMRSRRTPLGHVLILLMLDIPISRLEEAGAEHLCVHYWWGNSIRAPSLPQVGKQFEERSGYVKVCNQGESLPTSLPYTQTPISQQRFHQNNIHEQATYCFM